ncbi:hypothetical protein AGABI2DRAFT_144875 [Agaricus bisporus var. bisporus H97]|uniref:hypothetical protein n=1 Tax=Agaricus bisporus var. bisporus (strain H97 / ATCC MYA-4626 / FGSC 10389) TaxID=936046 RepID=UPI00029F6F6F|nr:hypothetical protein AGABI2DRAFT_144875 [Agaricus bisporus var. bisporus H97]EKV45463.1 hypothetical protein AGABI2DRAFT_144875 [Agaricus bisporus var. bisporus H97]
MAGVVSPRGYIYVSLFEEEIVGVALWFGPGDELFATEEQRAAHYDKWNQERGPALVQWWNVNQAPPVNQLVKNSRKDTWSLSLLAVSPHHRRRRIAYNLCKFVMDKAMAQGEGASVLTQSQDNVKIYETMGFSMFGDVKIVGGPGGDYTIFSLTFNWPPMEPEHKQ